MHSELPDLKQITVSDLVKSDATLSSGWNEEWQSYDIDAQEDALLDLLETKVGNGCPQGGNIIEWHVVDIFPERWIDLVVVLRCDHSRLWDRLEKRSVFCMSKLNHFRLKIMHRGYTLKKIQENNEAEIMQSILQDARDSYAEDIVVELQSETPQDIESNVERIKTWVHQWRKDRDVAE